MWNLLTGRWEIHLPHGVLEFHYVHLIRDFISIKCQEWLLYLKATKDVMPLHQGHSIPSHLLPLFLFVTATFWQYFMAILESWSHLHLSLAHCPSPFPSVFHSWYVSLPFSLSSFQSFSFSSVFYSCCNSHLTFLLGDYFIMRAQLPPSLSPTCPPPFPTPLVAVHLSFLIFQDYFRHFFFIRERVMYLKEQSSTEGSV